MRREGRIARANDSRERFPETHLEITPGVLLLFQLLQDVTRGTRLGAVGGEREEPFEV